MAALKHSAFEKDRLAIGQDDANFLAMQMRARERVSRNGQGLGGGGFRRAEKFRADIDRHSMLLYPDAILTGGKQIGKGVGADATHDSAAESVQTILKMNGSDIGQDDESLPVGDGRGSGRGRRLRQRLCPRGCVSAEAAASILSSPRVKGSTVATQRPSNAAAADSALSRVSNKEASKRGASQKT